MKKKEPANPPRKRGKPPIPRKPEIAAMVERLSAEGAPQEDIATVVGMCVETLQKLYHPELRLGKIKATSTIAGVLYKKAKNGEQRAIEFWLNNRGGEAWRQKEQVTIEHKDGGPTAEERARKAHEDLKAMREKKKIGK